MPVQDCNPQKFPIPLLLDSPRCYPSSCTTSESSEPPSSGHSKLSSLRTRNPKWQDSPDDLFAPWTSCPTNWCACAPRPEVGSLSYSTFSTPWVGEFKVSSEQILTLGLLESMMQSFFSCFPQLIMCRVEPFERPGHVVVLSLQNILVSFLTFPRMSLRLCWVDVDLHSWCIASNGRAQHCLEREHITVEEQLYANTPLIYFTLK